MKTKIFQIKSGYTTIASFDNLEAATKFFADMVKGSGRDLQKVSGDGEKTKYAYYWGKDREFTMSINEVDIYPTKKDADFAVFKNDGGDETDI